MLGILSARLKPWILTALSSSSTHRLQPKQPFLIRGETCKRHHSSSCRIGSSCGGGAASIWHGIFPSGSENRSGNLRFHHEQKGEGSWNVSWDVRPARWLHGSDSAWLLFGVCNCFSPSQSLDCCGENLVAEKKPVDGEKRDTSSSSSDDDGFRVIGVPGDGRCLFRAVTYGACLKCGGELPDENCQRELADDLRARVANELLKRREETEWIIEGDFDMYIKSIQQPNSWGGEPELLMASHVLQMPISVFMIDRKSRGLVKIASYGDEYEKNESHVQVLFHGYGHYDVLEILS